MEPAELPCTETERLQLRIVTPELYRHVMSAGSDHDVKAFLGLPGDEALAKERDRYERGVVTWNRSFRYFRLIEKSGGQMIGWCGFHTWYLQHSRAELGYGLFDPAHRGRGFMKEALGPVITYGFGLMGLNRIEAFVAPTNDPSLSLLRHFRFKEEGLLKEHYMKDGQAEDSMVFALLRNDY